MANIIQKTQTVTNAASDIWEAAFAGNFFRLLTLSQATGINIKFWQGGKPIGDAIGVLDGFAYSPDGGFSRVSISSPNIATQDITIAIADGEIRYDRFSGNVSLSVIPPIRPSPANTAKTVTNATAQLLAANAARSFLFIQNKDPAARVWLNFGAGAATQANGLLLEPGDVFAPDSNVPITAIQAIGDAASNANVVAIEG